MAAIAKALADPVRLQLVDVLRKAGIVACERQGLWAYYYVNNEALEEVSAWLMG